MEKLKIGLLYLGIHHQLVKGFGVNKVITNKEFYTKISRHFLLPRNIRPALLKEMEEKKLVEKVNRDSIKILPCEIDIEKDVSKLYQMMGLF